jgi:vacuolar-type H+-ATPase subunit I/STV1
VSWCVNIVCFDLSLITKYLVGLNKFVVDLNLAVVCCSHGYCSNSVELMSRSFIPSSSFCLISNYCGAFQFLIWFATNKC